MVSPAQSSRTTKIGDYVPADAGNSSSSDIRLQHDHRNHSPPPAEGEDLPLYTQDNSDVWKEIDELATTLLNDDGDELPIMAYPTIHVETPTSTRRAQVVKLYFEAISKADMQLLTAILERNLVTPETINKASRTPLLAAVEAEKATSVRFLIDAGADVNAYGDIEKIDSYPPYRMSEQEHTYRTPLQYAAQLGNFTIVKVLMENGADDALIAPDGQLALRLAATNGHREIVEYLPNRRGGGFKRWKVKHATAMRRCKRAAHGIYMFSKVIVYEIPRFIVWSVPKHLLVLPIAKRVKWLHAHRAEIPGLIAEEVRKVWRWLKEVPAAIWKGIKKAPGTMARFAKGTAEFFRDLVKETRKFVTRIPAAIAIAAKWFWNGIKKTGAALGNMFAQLFSFVHTVFAAIIGFFQRITLQDVWNGFMATLRAILIDTPVKIWGWLKTFTKTCEKIAEKLFGCIGWLLWILVEVVVYCVTWVVVYVPVQLGKMVMACGASLVAGCKEIMVWIDPKRA